MHLSDLDGDNSPSRHPKSIATSTLGVAAVATTSPLMQKITDTLISALPASHPDN